MTGVGNADFATLFCCGNNLMGTKEEVEQGMPPKLETTTLLELCYRRRLRRQHTVALCRENFEPSWK